MEEGPKQRNHKKTKMLLEKNREEEPRWDWGGQVQNCRSDGKWEDPKQGRGDRKFPGRMPAHFCFCKGDVHATSHGADGQASAVLGHTVSHADVAAIKSGEAHETH